VAAASAHLETHARREGGRSQQQQHTSGGDVRDGAGSDDHAERVVAGPRLRDDRVLPGPVRGHHGVPILQKTDGVGRLFTLELVVEEEREGEGEEWLTDR
jgi:hypothetical protein